MVGYAYASPHHVRAAYRWSADVAVYIDAARHRAGFGDAGLLMHMRTTIIIDPDLLERARELTGIREKTALVRAGLEAS